MKTINHYGPEDIEALLAEKTFRELLPEEQTFVLEHLASPEEYEQMRETLLAIRGAAGNDGTAPGMHPSPRVKQELLAAFEEEKKRRALIWWNSLGLFLRNQLRFDLPVVRIAFASVVILLAAWLVYRLSSNEQEKNPAVAKQETVRPASAEKKLADVPVVKDSSPGKIIVAPDEHKAVNQQPVKPANNTEFAGKISRREFLQKNPQGASGPNKIVPDTARLFAANAFTNARQFRRPHQVVVPSRILTGPYANSNLNNLSNNGSNNLNNVTISLSNDGFVNNGTALFDAHSGSRPDTLKLMDMNSVSSFGSIGTTAKGNDSIPPVLSTTQTLATVCSGSAANLTVTGATSYSFSWSNPAPAMNNAVIVNQAFSSSNYTITTVGGAGYRSSVPKSRSLASDAFAISLYAELK